MLKNSPAMKQGCQTVEKVCLFQKVLVLNPYPLYDTLMALHRAKLGVSLFRHPCRKPLSLGEGLCMLCWLCICATVVVCCRCVLHRLCSTTCMRPCIEPLGIHARHPCRAECGAAALTKQGRLQSVAHSRCTMQRHQRLTTRIGATPQTPFLKIM